MNEETHRQLRKLNHGLVCKDIECEECDILVKKLRMIFRKELDSPLTLPKKLDDWEDK